MPASPALQWALLLVGAIAGSVILQALHMPGALLIGPMLCGVVFATMGGSVRMPRPLFVGAQGILGCLIAHAVTAEILATIGREWIVMLAAVLSTIGAAGLVALAMTRWGSLPGSVPAWGLSPGAASAMIGMAEEYGSDPRLVAFMQYFRAVSVVICSSLITLAIAGPHGPAPASTAPPSGGLLAEIGPLAATLALAFVGAWIGTVLRLPSGGLLGPMLIGSVLHATGLLEIALPAWLLSLAYVAIGLYVGLRFTRETILLAWRAVPEIAAATLVLIALGALSAWILTHFIGTDFLTAFLATSPGGLDSVSIIALGTNVDLSFVLALQTLRLFLVTLTGPIIAKLILRTAKAG